MHKERLKRSRDGVNMGFDLQYRDLASLSNAKGEVFITLTDSESGKVLEEVHKPNVITADASILAAILFADPASRDNGANMLSVGTGATGSLLLPNAPDPGQRKLNTELSRKPWSSVIFRDATGAAVAIPTNVVDFTCTYDESEAVGPLNEMGILSTISDNPLILNPNPDIYPIRDLTRDLTTYDILVNYLTFPVISKPATARLTITWRITF